MSLGAGSEADAIYVGVAGLQFDRSAVHVAVAQNLAGDAIVSLAQASLDLGRFTVAGGRIGVPFGLVAPAEGGYDRPADQPVGSPLFRVLRQGLGLPSEGLSLTYYGDAYSLQLSAYRPATDKLVSEVLVTQDLLGGLVNSAAPVAPEPAVGTVRGLLADVMGLLPPGALPAGETTSERRVDVAETRLYHAGMSWQTPKLAGGLDVLDIETGGDTFIVYVPHIRASLTRALAVKAEGLYETGTGAWGISGTGTYGLGDWLLFATVSEFPDSENSDASAGVIWNRDAWAWRLAAETADGILERDRFSLAVGYHFR